MKEEKKAEEILNEIVGIQKEINSDESGRELLYKGCRPPKKMIFESRILHGTLTLKFSSQSSGLISKKHLEEKGFKLSKVSENDLLTYRVETSVSTDKKDEDSSSIELIDVLKEKNKSLEKEINELKSKEKENTKNLEIEKKDMKISDLEKSIESYKKESENLKEKNSFLEEKEKDINRLEERTLELENSTESESELKSKISDMEIEIESLKKDLSSSRANETRYKNQLEKLKKEK